MSNHPSQPTHDEIALLAYKLSEGDGRNRSPDENWLEAERILKSQKRQAAPAPKAAAVIEQPISTQEPPKPKAKKGKQAAAAAFRP